MAMTVAELMVRVNADTAGAKRGLADLSRQVDKTGDDVDRSSQKMGSRMEAAGQKMSAVGTSASKYITLPIVGMGAVAVKAFMGFDDAMTKSLSIMSNVSPQMRSQMEKTARSTAVELGMSANDAAKAYYYLGSAGMNAKQAMAAMPAVARFAKAGNFDMATATELAADAQSALGLKSKDAAKNLAGLTRVTDVFTKTANLSNTSVEQISKAMTNKAGTALRNLNKDMEEGAAVLAVFADKGIKGEKAGESLSIVLRDLQTAALNNKDAFAKQGVAVFDSHGKMRNVADIVADLEGSMAGMSDAQRKATLAQMGFTDESQAQIMTLVGSSQAIRDYEKELRNAGGTTQDVADKQMKSLSEQMNVAKARAMDAAISFGAIIAPAFVTLVGGAATVMEKLAGFLEAIGPGGRKAVAVILGLVAAIGPMLVVGGKLITGIRGVIAGTNSMGVALKFLAANPVVLIVAAIAALAYGLYLAYQKSETFRAVVNKAFEIVKGSAETLGGVIKTFAKFFTETLPNAGSAVLDWFRGNWKTIATIISGPFAPLVALATDAFGIRSAMVGGVTALIGTVRGLAGQAASAFKSGFEAVTWDIPGLLARRVTAAISGIVDTVRDKARAVSSAVVGGITGLTWGFGEILQTRIIAPIGGIVETVTTKGRAVSNAVITGITGLVWGFGEILNTRLITPIANIVETIKTKGGQLAGQFIQGVKDKAVEVWEAGLAKFRGFINMIIGFLNRLPFVSIGELKAPTAGAVGGVARAAEGTIVRGPQITMIGEAGPEAVIPLGRSRRAQTARLLTQAASIAGLTGDWGDSPRRSRLPHWSSGGIAGFPSAAGSNMAELILRGAASGGENLLERIGRWGREALASILDKIPSPEAPGFLGVASWLKTALVDFVRGAHKRVGESRVVNLIDALDWSRAKRGLPYVWGGGHGGWNWNLSGYDCSGAASHAAKKAGSSIGGPGTTMSLSPISTRHGNTMAPFSWGFRGMQSGDPRRQHMGWGILGNWFQSGGGAGGFGNATGGEWSYLTRPPGISASLMRGLRNVPKTMGAVLHRGESVLSPSEASAWRSGGGGGVHIHVEGNTLLGSAPEVAERLARILEPKMRRLTALQR